MSWKPWKSLEKEVAEYFGGVRKIRYQFDEVAGDILHPTLAIECKYGKQIPKYLIPLPGMGKVIEIPGFKPIIIISSTNLLTFHTFAVIRTSRKEAVFLTDGLKQALKYPSETQRIPILCFKPPGRHGFMAALLEEDWKQEIYLPLSNNQEPALKAPAAWAISRKQEMGTDSSAWLQSNHIEPKKPAAG